MIAASKPLEFIPQGRQAVEEHANQFKADEHPHFLPTEFALLHRMQNVNINDVDGKEYWCLRERFDDTWEMKRRYLLRMKQNKSETKDKNAKKGDVQTNNPTNYLCEYLVNAEDELYFKNCIAVWTKGISDKGAVYSRICFSTETPIKFAFFCNPSFVNSQVPSSKDFDPHTEEDFAAVGIIDQYSLRVYRNNGENFISNLEFPVSQVWKTKYGLLLEKVASNAVIQNLTISMPRVFSLAHPLDETCPLLHKPASNIVGYLIESDYIILYSSENSDLLLLFDKKISKHCIAQLRKATQEEINSVGSQNDSSVINQTSYRSGTSLFSQNSIKPTGATPKNSTGHLGRASFGNANYSNQISKMFSGGNSVSSPIGNQSRNSTMAHSFISIQDLRKVGQSQPSKPILPDLCLEHIWTEKSILNTRDYREIASGAFIHVDILEQNYFCYLLTRSQSLQMVRFTKYEDISIAPSKIPAKDAVTLNLMKMICVLDPLNNLLLYTGTVLVSKILVAHAISSTPNRFRDNESSPSFPRRSSLLPNAVKQKDLTFEEELHLLSPVQPLHNQQSNFHSNVCLKMRDPAGNRVTLIYPYEKMYRISLPVINESKIVSRCIVALRQILNKTDYVQFIIRWYSTRNPPGSSDYTIEKEWEIFKDVLMGSMGYLMSANDSSNVSNSFDSDEPKKRRRNSEVSAGSDDDWHFLNSMLGAPKQMLEKPVYGVDSSAPLFPWIPAIFYSLHLLYEDFKLDEAFHDNLALLGSFLYHLAIDMQLSLYTFHYALEQPQLLKHQHSPLLTEDHAAKMYHKDLLQLPVPNVQAQVEHILKNHDVSQYNYIEDLNTLSRNVLQVISVVIHGHLMMKKWIKPLVFENSVQSSFPARPKRYISMKVSRSEQVVQMLLNMEMTRNDIKRLPAILHLIIAECLENARISPPVGCSPATYELILRSELVEHAKLEWEVSKRPKKRHDVEDSLSLRCPGPTGGLPQLEPVIEDGMENVDTKLLCLRFPDDMRVAEVRRLLTSSEPVLIDIVQSAGTSDHDFIEEQEKQLFAICTRTMTLPVGRGMFTLRTLMPAPTESTPIPKLCLSGKEPTKGASVEMQQIEIPPNMNLWPTFHNGVAAGLKISPNASDINSTWIVYNKPKGPTDSFTEHAGFLMALGLNGHLKSLSFMSVYEYLVKCDEMTNIGLLLGISATHRGSMDNTITKLLSVHIEALLPATALELDIPQNIQVASLMGIGLLYQSTAKRHIAEVLLQEVGRPPGPEMENCVERESYSLTAGLALGLVTLGKGESAAGLRDLQLPDILHYYMVGGTKRPLTGSQKEKYKLPSFQIREGKQVNIDVTAPGASLALGLMFFNSDNRAIAEWMNPPNTRYQLDLVRPDLLLLRTIARNLIMWSEIEPDENWLLNQFPENLRFDQNRSTARTEGDNLDHEAITQAYCNIIAGSAFCIGLKYAGTENPESFKALRKMIKQFMAFHGKYVGEYAGRTTIEDCLMVLLISISLVFAGSGNLDILRMIRFLRSRIGTQYPQVTYGSYMAMHMALGFLYLGAGRFTISQTPEAVAALVCALFPKFPNHSNDNRYHLQAFRHLYVLAVEPRLFLPRDIDTKKLCLCKISVLEIDSDTMRQLPIAPCMLPNLNTLQKVIVDDPNYWPVSFEKDRNWQQLINALEYSLCIDVKKRSGCLSNLEDPDRLKSLLAQTLTTEQFICWEIDPNTLERFASEPGVIAFTDRFLHNDFEEISKMEKINKNFLILLFYNSVIRDKTHVFPVYLGLYDITLRVQTKPTINDVWQMRILNAYVEIPNRVPIIYSNELVSAQLQRFITYIEGALKEFRAPLRALLSATNFHANIIENLNENEMARMLAVVCYYSLTPNILNLVSIKGKVDYFTCFAEFRKLNLEFLTIFGILKIIEYPNK